MSDAVVIGAGPNGLAAAIELARAGHAVCVYERLDVIGGGARTAELTLPGFHHDVCSAVHPGVAGSPAFARYDLDELGLAFIEPEIQAAHPLDDGRAAALHRSLDATADALGADGAAYRRLVGGVVDDWPALSDQLFGPIGVPRHPAAAARFARRGLPGALRTARSRFQTARGRALVAGMAAHSMRPLDAPATSAFALVLLAMGHVTGWPLPRGGSGQIAAALAARLDALGGRIETGREIASLDEVSDARAVLFDTSPRALGAIAGAALPPRYHRAVRRYRYGPGIFKVDYALSEPVPWRAEECRRAGTVHLGGTLEEIARSEHDATHGRVTERPFVLTVQPSVFDPTRAPAGGHTLWAYCHVPNGSTADRTAAIDAQIERFAPGFGEIVLARATRGPAEVEADNPNCIGGEINGGAATVRQILARPVASPNPYATPDPRLYLCSASTPPGGGVHGMCGYHAAHAALHRALG